ncbi:MAG TPA: hypothetical protein VG347_25355 [Verrucomicrobiae bacterium]|nr:hypothetical protein [Verrucomicrobiae bacterium]
MKNKKLKIKFCKDAGFSLPVTPMKFLSRTRHSLRTAPADAEQKPGKLQML